MHIAVTGSHGLVGTAMIPAMSKMEHQVTRLVRGQAGVGSVVWDPTAKSFDSSVLQGVDAVVHLAGENIASSRWTSQVKERIRKSRVQGTRILAEGLAAMPTPPRVFISASAIGYYGDCGDELLDEDSPSGNGFLADTVLQWEAATQPASDAGIRVVRMRIGVILSPRGGALAKMLLPFKLGAGGRVGNGRQWWSWIALDDVVGAILYLLSNDAISGPVNVVSPNPVSNSVFTKILGQVLKRPTIFPMPAVVARIVLGEMANELLLASTRVQPEQLLETGYQFQQPELSAALQCLLKNS